ncbi:MAG: ABC transporter substrate-binding protein [Eubacteriales bacterium]|nr:ABC transporter substrate-binding protein [Eubacteriales bacterium]
MKKLFALALALLLVCSMQFTMAESFTVTFDVPATGKTFKIYSWNDEFQGMLANYYIPAVGGSVDKDGALLLPNGDKIEFVINPNDNGVYQQKLDAALQAGEQIDMFLMEADYALKYVDSEYTMPLESVGITEAMMENQYPYTIDVAKDSNGVVKGSSWQAAPGLFLYRRSLAEKYFGVKTPEEMQEKVKDWDAFLASAKEVAEKSEGATKLIPSNGDVWQVLRTARTQPWVNESFELVLDDQVKWYFDFAKTLYTENLTANAAPWSEAWNAGIGNDSIMGYFFSTWGIQWVMTGNSGGSKPGEGTYGDWAAVNGPQPYYWGGTWLAVGQKCENLPLAKSIIEYFTINADSMKDYCLKSKDYVNNKVAVQAIIDDGFSFDFLGGQDHYKLFQDVTPLIDTSAMSAYDQNINIALDEAVNAYIRDEKDFETAIAEFKTAVVDLFPEVTAE